MKFLEKIQRGFNATSATLASLVKVPLMSGAPSSRGAASGPVVVMGNGPSLRTAIDECGDLLKRVPLMSVNFAPLTPEFFDFRPSMHILADGLFFADAKMENVEKMWQALARVDWQLTLFVPTRYRKDPSLRSLPSNIHIKYFNLTPIEGFGPVKKFLYRCGLGMPRPRNVLVPAIMTAMREGYTRVILIGADHSWSKTLWVNDENLVITVQPHFYKENEKEQKRVDDLYRNIRLHQIYESFSIAFRSYFNVKEYADSIGVQIVNATPESFIDAFPRQKLRELLE